MDNLFKLFGKPTSLEQAADQIRLLRSALISAIQDLWGLKEMLRKKNLWSEDLYKELRIERMVEDHSGAGPAPWYDYSYFKYTLGEQEFLKEEFNATDEEVLQFKKNVEFVKQLS